MAAVLALAATTWATGPAQAATAEPAPLMHCETYVENQTAVSYCINVNEHRVTLVCAGPAGSFPAAGPWRPAGQTSTYSCPANHAPSQLEYEQR